jgi:DNA/RNA-binding domain of Phe-tRNA-synthetase-like protein
MSTTTLDGLTLQLFAEPAAIGWVIARGARVAPAPEALIAQIDRAIAAAKTQDVEARTREVRDLLRHGKYKPTGRGKPASEYLLAAAREDRFPRINNLVDASNWVSLATLLPISLIDLGKAGASGFSVRRGRAGEAYVFNSGDQVIELEDLLLTAADPGDRATANPVKDSMATKLGEGASDVLAVIYAPAALAAEARRATELLGAALAEHGGAAGVSRAILGG